MTVRPHVACDGPGCDTWTHTLTDGWWAIQQLPGGPTRHYCTPDCALTGLAQVPPTEEVP